MSIISRIFVGQNPQLRVRHTLAAIPAYCMFDPTGSRIPHDFYSTPTFASMAIAFYIFAYLIYRNIVWQTIIYPFEKVLGFCPHLDYVGNIYYKQHNKKLSMGKCQSIISDFKKTDDGKSHFETFSSENTLIHLGFIYAISTPITLHLIGVLNNTHFVILIILLIIVVMYQDKMQNLREMNHLKAAENKLAAQISQSPI